MDEEKLPLVLINVPERVLTYRMEQQGLLVADAITAFIEAYRAGNIKVQLMT